MSIGYLELKKKRVFENEEILCDNEDIFINI